MRRYGYDEEAATIAYAILEAAEYFLGRLPEGTSLPRPLPWKHVDWSPAAD